MRIPAAILLATALAVGGGAGKAAAAGGLCLVYQLDADALTGRILAELEGRAAAELAKEPAIAVRDFTRIEGGFSFAFEPAAADAVGDRLRAAGAGSAVAGFAIEPAGSATVTLIDEGLQSAVGAAADAAGEIVGRRLAGQGITVADIDRIGDDRLAISLPDYTDVAVADQHISPAAALSFRLVEAGPALPAELAAGPGQLLLELPGGLAILTDVVPSLDGNALGDARAELDAAIGQPVITVSFNAEGTARFADVTSAHVGSMLAIVIDDHVASAPIIREPIMGGVAQISGNTSLEDAERLAALLRSGALPAPLRLRWQGDYASCASLATTDGNVNR